MLYKIDGTKLNTIEEKKFNLEREVQKITEDNIQSVFGLRFIATEFQLHGLRVDTLAFDDETHSFVVIEYKRDKSFSVIDQGYAYLALLLNNKADFILEYNENQKDNLKRDDVDWSQSRVFFVADSFTSHQRQAINFRDLPMELWEVKRYAGNMVGYTQLKPQAGSESIKTITKNDVASKVNKEVRVITVEDHFAGKKAENLELYEAFRDKILTIDPQFQENPRVGYIGFSMGQNGSKTLVYVHVLSSGLRIDIPRIYPADVNDPLNKLTYKPKSLEQFNTPISKMTVATGEDIVYAWAVLQQVYQKYYVLHGSSKK